MTKRINRPSLRVQAAKSVPGSVPGTSAAAEESVVEPALPVASPVAPKEAPADLPQPPKAARAPRAARAPALSAKTAINTDPKSSKEKFDKITFSLSRSETQLLDELKQSRHINGKSLKKSQLLRAGLLSVANIDDARLAQLVAELPVAPARHKRKGK